MPEKPIIIIGSGLAGYTLAREFRKLDKESPVILISSDDGQFYSKPMLSNAFANNKKAGDIAMFDAAQMTDQLNANIHTNTLVHAIDPGENTISIAGPDNAEQSFEYSSLVLAIGADQIQLPFAGNAADETLSVNDLSDYTLFREQIDKEGVKSIAIIGGGLIGCEFANDLNKAGFDVHVIERNKRPLQTLLPEEAAASLHDSLAQLGIEWHLEKSVTEINSNNGQYQLTLSDDSSDEKKLIDEIDLVLTAIGLQPRIALASASGIQTNRGIVVDRYLRTNIPNIFALGDCAEVHGLVLPYVMPLMNAARALAKTLANQVTQVTYPAMPVAVKTPACPVVILPPPAGLEGQWQTSDVDNGTKSLFIDKDNNIRGFALTGAATSERAALNKEVPGLLI